MSKFEEFWSRYPNKTGKRDAEKKWDARKLDEQWDRISKFLDWAPLHDEKWKKGFIPMGSTFINQERWNDHDFHLKPRLPSGGSNPLSTAPDLGRVVEWIKTNKRLTEQQITSPWTWLSNGQRVIGVRIPDMPDLFFKSFTEATQRETLELA